MKLNSKYLSRLISEVLAEESNKMAEIGENFGATADAEVLAEAWDSQWPSNFLELKERIKEFTDKGKVAEGVLAKYAFEAMNFNFLSPRRVWDSYGRLFKSFVRTYVRDEEDLSKLRQFISKVLNPTARMDFTTAFLEAKEARGKEAALRTLNKKVSGLNKQIRKMWSLLGDKGVDWAVVGEEFDIEINKLIQKIQFQEAGSITGNILEIINFVNADKSDDNAKKLAAFYKKINDLGSESIIDLTNSWVADQKINIDMTLCPDAEVGAACVMHKFEDGFFWYDIVADDCDITARKMNSCGQASMDDSELFNLMSYSETGKPRWHVTVEWNQEEKSFIQILGNANTVPKEEHWPYIKWLYENYEKPEISNYAWEHVRGNNVKQNVYNFLQYLGVKSNKPETEKWDKMKEQITAGFYNSYSWEGDNAPEGDFARLKLGMINNRVTMSVRIKRRLVPADRMSEVFGSDSVKDYKAAGKRLEENNILFDEYIQDMIPRDWDEFFEKGDRDLTQRVRFSYSGNMMLYFNWTSKILQELGGGRSDDPAYRNQLQREGLGFFLTELKENFSVEAMEKLGKDLGDRLEGIADDITMNGSNAGRKDELTEGTRKLDRTYLTSMILEVIKSSSNIRETSSDQTPEVKPKPTE